MHIHIICTRLTLYYIFLIWLTDYIIQNQSLSSNQNNFLYDISENSIYILDCKFLFKLLHNIIDCHELLEHLHFRITLTYSRNKSVFYPSSINL